MKTVISSTLICIAALLAGCSKAIVEPEVFGNIQGVVTSGDNNSGVAGVSIETSPATEAVLTGANGEFHLQDIPAGNYQIKAFKPNFKAKSVDIMVREERTTSAKILLVPEEDNSTAEFLQPEITTWYQKGQTDSSYVEIEYRVYNANPSAVIGEFEVYFDIFTDQETFYYEINETELDPGEQTFGTFQKYIRDTTVDSVVISGVWVKE